MTKKRILIIYTGGTIGMIMNKLTGALDPFPFDDIYQHLPMLKLINAHISFEELTPIIDSSDTNPQFWIRLARTIYDNYDQYDGFVVLHGTDTMSYTASALSFLLENLRKPVILTGSQLPLGVMRTDGRENILNSIEIATDACQDPVRLPEVCLYFENSLYRGNRTYKDNAEEFNAFMSANYPKLAEVGVNIKYNDTYITKIPNDTPPPPLILHDSLNENIVIVKLYPGINKSVLRLILSAPNLRAVIMETYGAGNAPSDLEFLSILKEAVTRGIIIVSVTQCKGGGMVDIGKYQTSLHLGEIGVISGYDITTEAAVTKLMYLLGCGLSTQEVKHWMTISIRGEMTTS